VSARGKRVSALALARSLRRKSREELQRIALANAHDERMLWAVLDALQPHRDAEHLKMQIRERLILKKPLPVPMRESAIWSTARRPSRGRPWYATLAFIVVVAVLIAVARLTEADARLIELVLDGAKSLGTYLTG
jgi:hypothetical protein